jgi:hypothetical protein
MHRSRSMKVAKLTEMTRSVRDEYLSESHETSMRCKTMHLALEA